MQTGSVTTPFGRRPMTLGLVRAQLQTAESRPSRGVDKWKVFRDVAEARPLLGLGAVGLSSAAMHHQTATSTGAAR